MPLPALLRRMSALISLASGASAEAEVFGVPSFFLTDAARSPFEGLLERGGAQVVDPSTLNAHIAGLPTVPLRRPSVRSPALCETLSRLEALARDYAQLRGHHEPCPLRA